ncbi:hypothetical protein L2E82_26072 [Cichorium intybus]|uniref:Uncharacterized protein n=1 Tax=Cichorium intybus TaxID=13427 RepID=A0ACB9E4Z9_CICIN|nr:hypothetical protein L2E82_26072 [Cichorium intybus]
MSRLLLPILLLGALVGGVRGVEGVEVDAKTGEGRRRSRSSGGGSSTYVVSPIRIRRAEIGEEPVSLIDRRM